MIELKGAFDFDGVIANTPRKKIELAAQIYGAHVDIKNYNHKGFIDAGMSDDEYKGLNDKTYSEYNLRPVQGCITYLRKIIDDGHKCGIRSYRMRDPGEDIINNFLIDYRLEIEDALCTDNQPKGQFCENLDFFVDDRAKHLRDVKKKAKNLFLFDTPYNKDENLTDGMLRVKGWKNLYVLIRKITNSR
jgi:hypothetical protein